MRNCKHIHRAFKCVNRKKRGELCIWDNRSTDNAAMAPSSCNVAYVFLMSVGVAWGTGSMLSYHYQGIRNSHTHTYLLLKLEDCEYSGSQPTLVNRAGVNVGG